MGLFFIVLSFVALDSPLLFLLFFKLLLMFSFIVLHTPFVLPKDHSRLYIHNIYWVISVLKYLLPLSLCHRL